MRKEIHLILDNIRSRENVGSIFRTADAIGVSRIYLCGITPTPESDQETRDKRQVNKITKTALGAEKWVPWEYQSQTWRCLLELKSKNARPSQPKLLRRSRQKLQIIGLEQTKNSKSIFKYQFPKNKKIALVVGNEVRGISPKILRYCDKIVHIPMYGRKESLNVSVAVGIALYQLIKLK